MTQFQPSWSGGNRPINIDIETDPQRLAEAVRAILDGRELRNGGVYKTGASVPVTDEILRDITPPAEVAAPARPWRHRVALRGLTMVAIQVERLGLAIQGVADRIECYADRLDSR